MLLTGAEIVERLGLPIAVSAEEARAASLWWTYSAAKAKRELGFSARPHEETLTDAVNWLIADLGDQHRPRSGPRRAGPRGRRRCRPRGWQAVALMADEIVLYRCRTPTNVLCPCGAVARKLNKLDLAYRTERVPYRRADRPEITELTGQRRVPVLIDGDEVIHDSKRINEYLQWRHGERDAEPTEEATDAPA